MREQLLAANHLVMGTTNILLLPLPDSWRVMNGPTGPEVDRWSEVANRRWMSQGRALYRLVEAHPEAAGLVRAEVELLITAVPGAVGEHAIRHAYGTAWKGLLPRREVPTLHVEIDCPHTQRRLRLDLNAVVRQGAPSAGVEDLNRLFAAMESAVLCH